MAARLNELTRQFVERSPFLCLATSAPDGTCDVSPRGDPSGFVRTGADDHRPRPLSLESSVAGVFAVGDVRSGSVKRVGAAIGEGAAVVAQLHQVLAEVVTSDR